MDDKATIVELINKIKYEVTEEQLSELGGCATPLSRGEFVDWESEIDNLDLTAGDGSVFKGAAVVQLRELLHRILELTQRVGGKVIPLGKRLIKWIFSLLDRYPNTMTAAMVTAAIAFLVAQIPLLRVILLPIVEVVAVALIGFVLLGECVGNAMSVGRCNR